LGGNIALNLCSRSETWASAWLDSSVAVCPPLNVLRCVTQLTHQSNGLYDRHFVNLLLRQLRRRRRAGLESPPVVFPQRPRSLLEFDTMFTAPAGGFESVESYYLAVSAMKALTHIRQPTLLLRAEDDPLAVCDALEPSQLSAAVECETTSQGGHLGFIGRAGVDPDRRWMDWRVVDWIAGRGR
jgi:predicted alpha/beta-fold hydrolase